MSQHNITKQIFDDFKSSILNKEDLLLSRLFAKNKEIENFIKANVISVDDKLITTESKLKSIIAGAKNKTKYADAIIQDSNGKILLLRRSADETNPNQWSLPGGHIDAGETPQEACERELKEETNLDIQSCWLFHILETDTCIVFYYMCYVTNFSQFQLNPFIILDNKEHYNYVFADKQKLEELDCVYDLKDMLLELCFSSSNLNATYKLEKAFEIIKNAFDQDLVDTDVFFKAKKTFEDEKKKEEKGKIKIVHGKKFKKTKHGWAALNDNVQEPKKEYNDDELKEHARKSGEKHLKHAIENGTDERHRKYAHEELKRRTKEESQEDEDSYENKSAEWNNGQKDFFNNKDKFSSSSKERKNAAEFLTSKKELIKRGLKNTIKDLNYGLSGLKKILNGNTEEISPKEKEGVDAISKHLITVISSIADKDNKVYGGFMEMLPSVVNHFFEENGITKTIEKADKLSAIKKDKPKKKKKEQDLSKMEDDDLIEHLLDSIIEYVQDNEFDDEGLISIGDHAHQNKVFEES